MLSTLDYCIENRICPCGGELEATETGWRCTRCGWQIIEVTRDA